LPQLELRDEQLEVVRKFGGIEQIVGRLMISHCLPHDCDFARQGIARLRLRSTLTVESDLRLFSAVGVRRVSMLGTVLNGMLTKSV